MEMRAVGKNYWNRIESLKGFCYNISSVNQSCSASILLKCFTKDLMDSPSSNRKFTSWDIFASIQTEKQVVNYSELENLGTSILLALLFLSKKYNGGINNGR